MKLGALLQVLDESDIIELFIRINSKVIDKFFIVDNNSCDSTPAIIEKMKAEGFDVVMVKDYNTIDDQSTLISNALRHLSKSEDVDWWLFPDADEFFSQSKDEIVKALESAPKHLVPLMKWKTWIPKNNKYLNQIAPLNTGFNPLIAEPPVFKVAIDRRRASLSKIATGAHTLHRADNNQKIDSIDVGIVLNHFPIRFPQQIISKALITSRKLKANPNIEKKQVAIIETANQIVVADYKIDENLLKELAINYACLGSNIVGEVNSDEKFGSPDDKIKYKDMVSVDAFKRFLHYHDCMSVQLREQYNALEAKYKKATNPVVMSSMR